MFEQLNGLADKRKAAVEAFQAEAKTLIEPTLKEFMVAHPSIKAVCWTQYTPFFNDGDSCVFGLHGVACTATGEDDDGPHGDGWHECYGEPEDGIAKADWEAVKALENTLGGLEDELQALFGDHTKVIVTKSGVTTEEYEHD